LTALFLFVSLFVVAGAQLADAAQCGKGNFICHLAFNTQPHEG